MAWFTLQHAHQQNNKRQYVPSSCKLENNNHGFSVGAMLALGRGMLLAGLIKER